MPSTKLTCQTAEPTKMIKLQQHTVVSRMAIERYKGNFEQFLNKYSEYMAQDIPGIEWRFADMREDIHMECYILVYEATVSEQEYMWHKLGGKWK